MSCVQWFRPVLFAILISFRAAATASPAHAADWSVRVAPFNQVFPALDISQKAGFASRSPLADDTVLGNGNGLISIHLRARHDGEHVRLTLAAHPWLVVPTTLDAVLPRGGQNYELHPVMDWDVQRLAALRAAQATRLTAQLVRDEGDEQEQVVPVNLRPLGDALYFVRDGRDSVDLSWIFAAYANEDDAVVTQLLADAKKSGIVDSFTGYAGAGDAGNGVLRQVWAVWHALTMRGIRYSGANPGIDRGPDIFSQRVRFLGDTWNDRSANCIDGSVLIVSALQRIGLRSFLVLVPGHAFVGFYTDADGRHASFVETTLLGAPLAVPEPLPGYAEPGMLTPSTRFSLASFDAARRTGSSHYTRDATRLDGKHRPDYAIIDIGRARELGIEPIVIEPRHALASGR